jgi:hypothetical protein
MPAAGAVVDALGEPLEEDTQQEVDIEPEDVHRAKWEQYKSDRAQLLTQGWKVRKAAASEGITVGATVRTKARANRREGVVTGQIKIDDTKHWLVDFSNGEEGTGEPMKAQQLVLVERNEDEYVWTLVKDSEPDPNTVPEEYTDGIGLAGFNFNELFLPEEAHKQPHLKLLKKMWPGDWQQQLRNLNSKIAADNTNCSRQKNYKAVNLVSEREWWVFIGVLISAGPQGRGGTKLWQRHADPYSVVAPINYGPSGLNIMAEYRFEQIKAAFPWSFQEKTKEETDPWHMILLFVDGFNKNRHDWVAASVRKTLNESMSAFRPRTSKTGGWPNISFILRKPEPLGTEFKDIACAVTGMCMLPSLPVKRHHG